MIDFILAPVANFIIDFISSLGYFGVIAAMAISSACIPIPTEVIMPFSGFLVFKGQFSLINVTLAGGFGSLIGSWIAYFVGFRGGERVVRNLIKKWGRFVLVTEGELDMAIAWFQKHGEIIAFSSRLLPVVRTFISLPAGIAKMEIVKFSFFSLIGSLISCYFLAVVGMKLGESWDILGKYFHKFDLLIVLSGAALVAWYVHHKLKKIRGAEKS